MQANNLYKYIRDRLFGEEEVAPLDNDLVPYNYLPSSIGVPKSIAFIGDSKTTGTNQYLFWNFFPFAMRSNAPELTVGVDPVNVDGNDVWVANLKIYADGTASWKAPGDDYGPRTPVPAATSDYRQLVFLESASPNMGMGVYITKDAVLQAAVDGTEEEFYIARGEVVYPDNSFGVWAQIYTGWKLNINGSYGISGQTAEDILARIDDVFYVDSEGKPLVNKPGIVVVNAGINGCVSLETLTTIRDKVLAHGANVIFCTLDQEAPDAGDFTFMQNVNRHIHTICDGNPMCHIANFFATNRDGNRNDGYALSGRMDGPHHTMRGGQEAGKCLANTIKEIIGQTNGTSRFLFAGDTSNRWPEGMVQGTSGKPTGLTGDVSFNWSYGGDGTCVASIETDVNGCPWQVFTVTDASLYDSLSFQMPVTASAGELVNYDIEVDISGNSVISFAPVLQITNNTLPVWSPTSGLFLTQTSVAYAPFSGIIRSPVFAIPSWIEEATIAMQIVFAAGDTVFKFRYGGVSAI